MIPKHLHLLKEKNITDIETYLTSKFNVRKITEHDYKYRYRFRYFKENIVNTLANQYYKLKKEDLVVSAYEVIYDANSQYYYEEELKHYKSNAELILTVFFEHKSRSIESNSEILQKELYQELGVNQFEYVHGLYHLHLQYYYGDDDKKKYDY